MIEVEKPEPGIQ